MKLLLDTHALLWYVAGHRQLSGTAENLIVDPANDAFMSPASYWEIAIKVSIGKLEAIDVDTRRAECPWPGRRPSGN